MNTTHELNNHDRAYIDSLSPYELSIFTARFAVGGELLYAFEKNVNHFVKNPHLATFEVNNIEDNDLSPLHDVVTFVDSLIERPCSLVRKLASVRDMRAGSRFDLLTAIESLKYNNEELLTDEMAELSSEAFKAFTTLCTYLDNVSLEFSRYAEFKLNNIEAEPSVGENQLNRMVSMGMHALSLDLGKERVDQGFDGISLIYALAKDELLSTREDDVRSVMFDVSEERTYPCADQLVVTTHLPNTPVVYNREKGVWCALERSKEFKGGFVERELPLVIMLGGLSWRECEYAY